MTPDIGDEKNLRAYLLGQIEDENLVEGIERCVLEDPDFLAKTQMSEESLIEEYVLNQLRDEELERFKTLFLSVPERREKILITKALHNLGEEKKQEGRVFSWKFLRQFGFFPKLAFGFLLLLIFIISGYWIIFQQENSKESLAKLQEIYSRERAVEARIADFSYSPLIVLRSDKQNKDNETARRKIEMKLIEAVEEKPNGENHNALGVFYLTERNFDKAIDQFENSLKYNPNDAKIRSNLGAALLEKGKLEADAKRFETLSRALEAATKAYELDNSRLEALFNRALILQELKVPRQAIEAWKVYMEKDGASKWGEEARRNLENIEKQKTEAFKPKEKILEDFLNAFRENNELTAWKIHSQTKEISTGQLLPHRLARSYLENTENELPEKARENLSALIYIGALEEKKAADFFFREWGNFYSNLKKNEIKVLLEAHQHLEKGFHGISTSDYSAAKTNFEKSRDLFLQANNILEAKITELWIGHCLTRLGKINQSTELMFSLIQFANEKNYKWLEMGAHGWLGTNYLLQNEYSNSIEAYKKSLALARSISDTYHKQRSLAALTEVHRKIGESEKALSAISQSLADEDLYFQSERQMWRNYIYASQAFDQMNFPEAAIAFGLENLLLGEEIYKNPAISHNSHISLSEMFEGKGDYASALEYAEKSRAFALKLPQDSAVKTLLAHSELQIGKSKSRMGNCTEGLKNLEQALGIYNEISEYTFLKYNTHKEKLFCFQALKQTDEFEKELALILQIFEKHRTQILEEQARNVFFDREQTVYDAATENSWSKGDFVAAFNYSEKSKARSLLDLINEKGKVSNQELHFTASVEPFSLNEIQARMPEQAQIVQFAVLPDKILAFIIGRNNFEVLKIEISQTELEEKIESFLNSIVKEKESSTSIQKKSAALFEILIKPIFPRLDRNKEIYFVSDKILNRLPFAALYSPETKKYLIEEITISSSPSATVFISATEKARNKPFSANEKILSIGNPAFDRAENPNLSDLKAAEREAREIAGLYPGATGITGASATQEAVLDELKKTEILHFAGHFLPNKTTPLFSKLVLARKEGETSGDLRVLEIAQQKNPNLKLAVLSACQTGYETQFNGEGAVGAARFFLAIGVPAVVASHWSIDSQATANLMTNFHRYRKQPGFSTAKALQKAQIEAIQKSDETNLPFYWAAFSSVGGFNAA
ncbi:MAG TPA: CHAT domain-containing protein [Pyrinomonadaceae bacterium]|nr:CHAT domain-containing protein [Pyrinomonadaceae bacterium]